jgi:ribosome-associated toxin RatA of RatAB toxin-antitoxin module
VKRAERSVDIEAPPRACFDALVDFESYPDWQSAVRDVEILADGDPVRVSFEVDAKVKKVRYVLDYHLEEPEHLSWDYVEGDVKAIEGEYRLEQLDGGGTRATYVLGIDPGMWVPGKVLSVLRDQVMKGSVEELKQRVEAGRA